MNREQVEAIKRSFEPGVRVKLKKLNGDWICPKEGDEGTVTAVDDAGTIHVNWDNGFRLGLMPDVDEFDVIIGKE